jgi:hypothetical protein
MFCRGKKSFALPLFFYILGVLPHNMRQFFMGIKQIYQLAKYYDIGFARETSGEVQFFTRMFKKYCPFEVKRLFEAA